MRRARSLGLLIALGAASAAAQTSGPRLVGRGGQAMGTSVEVRIYTTDEAGAQWAITAAFEEMERLERLMTTWSLDSEVSRINQAAGAAAVEVSPEIRECVERALEFSRLSQGAFDISFHALRGLWRFDEDLLPRLPDARELRRRLPLVDYRRIHVDPLRGTIFLEKPGMAIHLGGIGKGYAVDRMVAVLRAHGFRDAIVQAGGDLMMSGSQGGAPWMAGIRDPRGSRDDYFAVGAVTDHAFSTAGDYERYFILNGRRYHHILDPRTGYPATGARSVTVWAPDATTADGLDDAVLILGPRRGLALIESIPGAGAVIVDAQNQVHVSSRLSGLVTLVHPPSPGP